MIEHWVKRYFQEDQVSEALAILSEYGSEGWHREPTRVKRDCVIRSRGSLKELRSLVELAKTDYRDILIGEEIDPWLISELKRYNS